MYAVPCAIETAGAVAEEVQLTEVQLTEVVKTPHYNIPFPII